MAAAILITGASRGLGFEFASQYSADGWRVFAACRSPAAATKLQRLAQDTEGMLKIVAMDVTDAESVQNATTQLKDVAIDVLINSAGIAGASGQKTGNADYESWAHVFNVNTMGPLRVVESFSDHIARSERNLAITWHGFARRQYVWRLHCLSQLQGGGEYGDAKRCDRFGAARHHLCFGQSRMGQDRYGRPQGAVVATGERDCHATAHRYVRPKSIGQVL
jgi:NAD(P)-dependent dehydrogenase (short-subunit alcohol dehydrogenase family)